MSQLVSPHDPDDSAVQSGGSGVGFQLEVRAPAKVNLHLGVGKRLPSGFHEVQTVLHTLALCDKLTLSVEDGYWGSRPFVLSSNPPVGVAMEQNLVYRAAIALAEHTGRPLVQPGQRLCVSLEKNIPQQAGLGGGSSDAAAMLFALATFWGLSPVGDECMEVAASLGTDVPFFLHGGCALMGSRGDVLQRTLPPLDTPVLLVNSPNAGVPTADAYRVFDQSPLADASVLPLVEALEAISISRSERVGALLFNNLEPAARKVCPEVGAQLGFLAGCENALGSLLSGSGSVAFALFATEAERATAAAAAQAQGLWTCETSLS